MSSAFFKLFIFYFEIVLLLFNPSDTERVFNLDLVTSMFVVCFRRSLDCQGEEQEAGGGNGGRFPGHPEHVNKQHNHFQTTSNTCWTMQELHTFLKTLYLNIWIFKAFIYSTKF